MSELDENAYLNRETFAHYGLAMYHAQCVEKSLAILVSSVFNREFLGSSLDRREAIQDEVFTKTVGRLLKRLKEQIPIPPNLDKTLAEALKKRNWLAHDYFWERAGHMLTSHGKEKMIEELTNLADFFLVASKWSEAFLKTVRENTGANEFTYVLAVAKVNGDRTIWENAHEFSIALEGNPIRIWTFKQVVEDILSYLGQTVAATEVGRILQMFKV